MMKVLLVSLKSDLMPVGLAYIAAAIEQAGHGLECYTFESQDLLQEKLRGDCDVVATGGLSLQYHALKAIAQQARTCSKKIIMGGGVITSEPEVKLGLWRLIML